MLCVLCNTDQQCYHELKSTSVLYQDLSAIYMIGWYCEPCWSEVIKRWFNSPDFRARQLSVAETGSYGYQRIRGRKSNKTYKGTRNRGYF